MSHQLKLKNYVSPTTEISGDSIRQYIVSSISNDAQLKSTIAERLSGDTIDNYLKNMAIATTWADENVFYAASKLYDLEIRILRCDGEHQPTTFGTSVDGRSIALGYVSYVVGQSPTHYVSLIPGAGLESSTCKILIRVTYVYLCRLY